MKKPAEKTPIKNGAKRLQQSAVPNTSAAEMPDPKIHSGPSEKDVRFAFRRK
jgi:hypothetical protein